MGSFLSMFVSDKTAHIAPDVLDLCRKMERENPPTPDMKLSWWTQQCYDMGIINHYQKYCIDYYGQ